MVAQSPTASNSSLGFSKIPLLICHLLVYFEFLLFLGITIFLIIYQREALFIGSESWYYFFLVPIIAGLSFGVYLKFSKKGQQNQKISIWLQISICIVNYTTVALLLYVDNLDYSSPVPVIFALFLCLVGLLLTNLIVLSKDKFLSNSRTDKRECIALQLALIGTWTIILFTIDIFATLIYFFIFSAIFHAIFFFLLLRSTSPAISRGERVSKLQFGENLFRFLVLLIVLVLAWNQVGFLNLPPDSLAAAYTFIFPSVASPLFLGGMILVVIFTRYKREIYGDLVVLGILLLAFNDVYFFAPLLLGYALLSVAFFLKARGPATFALASVLMLLGSLVAMYLFFYNADVRAYEWYALIYAAVVGFLASILGISILFHLLRVKREINTKKIGNPNAVGRG